MSARLVRAAPLLALAATLSLASGCAYFNGIYNARQAEHRGDQALRHGRDGEAAGFFSTSAEKAETVLVRHGKSRWSNEALYLAGRGWALSGSCDHALPRIGTYLQREQRDVERRERALLALGICDVRAQRFADARATLEPLTASKRQDVVEGAALWGARAAMALGDADGARDLLRHTSTGAADWELVGAYLARQRYEPAETLLVRRARQGDYRREASDAITTLWSADRLDMVQELVRAYDGAKMRVGDRAAMHLLVGDLLFAAGNDSAARRHFVTSVGLARDSVAGRESASRLTLLSLRTPNAMADVEAIIRRGHDSGAGTRYQQRLEDNLLLLKMLESKTDYTGASLFLAGEVARDSLRAPVLAHALFKRLITGLPASPLAPKALLAAAELEPDSAEAYESHLRANYASSPYTMAIDRADNPRLDAVNPADELLRRAWETTVTVYGDSIVARRKAEAAKAGGTAAVPPAAPPSTPPASSTRPPS